MATSLAQKLQLKPGQPIRLGNAPEGMEAALAAEGLALDPAATAVLLFVRSMDEVRALVPGLFASAAPEDLLWIAYPKGSSKVPTDLNRDKLWQALSGSGWRPVRQIALDETWSAMRFRPAV